MSGRQLLGLLRAILHLLKTTVIVAVYRSYQEILMT